MDVREKLVELLMEFVEVDAWDNGEFIEKDIDFQKIASDLIAHGVTVQGCARPLEEWGEDYGDVLWWNFPIEEPPYVGSPLDEKWPAYHTHWTPIVMPQPPKGE